MLYTRRNLPLACLVLLLFLVALLQYRTSSLTFPLESPNGDPGQRRPDALGSTSNGDVASREARCASFRASGLDEVAVVLKTGATEIYEKLPIHFITTFDCIGDYLIYSDVAQRFGDIQAEDALANITGHNLGEHADLKQYEVLKQHVALYEDAQELRGQKSWKLDKYKFLPMISDAYSVHGNSKKWYMFIEADTYLCLHNLLLWLDKLDHQRPVYAGAQILIGETEFAHGGSGILLSATAAKLVSETYLGNQEHWDDFVAHSCCGDLVLGEMLLAANPATDILRAFPSIQGETLDSLDWSETHWCRPAVTWHHVDAAGIDKLWQSDREWREEYGTTKPMLFRDHYARSIHPRFMAVNGTLRDWDNLSKDWKMTNPAPYDTYIASATACEALCRQRQECVQWAWRPGSCRGGRIPQLGWALKNRPALGSAEDYVERVDGADLEGAVSGWLLDRIEQYKQALESCDESRPWFTKNE